MGKASKWFRAFLGLKKSDPNPNTFQIPQPPKKKWSFAKSLKEKGRQKSQHGVVANDIDPSHHAVAVAAATAAVAEAAVAAAQAAAVVVQLTSGTGRNTSAVPGFSRLSTAACVREAGAGRGSRKDLAAVTIQSHFRAYLSRRALRALKALVKLQALVRGHILRKQTADVLRRMQALERAQARARAGRFLISDSSYASLKSSHFSYHGPPMPEEIEHVVRTRSMKHEQLSMFKRNDSRSSGNVSFDAEKLPTICNRMDCRLGERSWEQGLLARSGPTDNEISDKILEVDTGKPYSTPEYKTIFRQFHATHPSFGSDLNCQSFSTSKDSVHQTVPSPTSGEVQSSSHLKFAQDIDETAFCTADSSPQFYSASSMGGSSTRGAFIPSKSDGSRSCLNGYTEHSNPNYMSYTESSKAKARSLSAPKQRLQYDRSGSTKRYSVHGFHESRLDAHAQRVFALQHANFTNKAYPGSGRLDRLGMPVREDVTGFSGAHWHRY